MTGRARTVTRPFQDGDAESATRCLVRAFDTDPLMRAMVDDCMCHDFDDAAPVMFAWITWMLHSSYRMTEVTVDANTGEVLCLAGWELPAMTVAMGLRGLAYIIMMLFWDGFSAVKMYIHLMGVMEGKRHTLAGGAHHLQCLGAKFPGNGYGSECIRVGIERATRAGADCYLESSNSKNIPFYQRHGFEVLEVIYPLEKDNVKGPPATLMLRKCDIRDLNPDRRVDRHVQKSKKRPYTRSKRTGSRGRPRR